MYRQILGKNLLYVLHMLHNMANFGPLTAEIDSGVWGTPANFNGIRVLLSLLQRHRSPKANQTLHDVWPPPGLLVYIYTFGGSCPLTEFRHMQNSLCVLVLRSPILAALLHGTPAAGSAKLCGAARYKECNYGTFAEGATCFRLSGHHIGHRPTF